MKGKFLSGILVAIIGVLVITASAPVMAQGAAPGDMIPNDPMSDHNGTQFTPHDDLTPEQAQERMEQMLNLAEQHKMFGILNYSEGVATGYFIQFEYSEETGEIMNYSVRTGETYSDVFQSVELVDFVPDDMGVHGSIMMQDNDTAKMIVHNNPTALLHVATNNSSAALSFLTVEGASVNETEVEGDLADVVNVSTSTMNGLIGVANGSIEVEETDSGIYVNVTVNEGQTFFRMKPYFAGGAGAHEEQVMNAIAQGKISNEMSIMGSNGDVMVMQQSYQHQYMMELQEFGQERIIVQVSSEAPEGKVMILQINNEVMESLGEKVKIDGEEVDRVSGLDQALNATGDALEDSVYSVESGEDFTTIAVYVPHFSAHTLEIGDDGFALSESALLIAIAIAGVALVTVAYAVARRK